MIDPFDPVFDNQLVHRGVLPEVLKRSIVMSITRRQFLLSIPAAVAGFTIPSFFLEATEYLANTGSPLLLPPPRQDSILFAVDDGTGNYQLNIGDPYVGPPQMTLREYIDTYFWGDDDDYMEEAELGKKEFRLALDDYIDEEIYLEQWCRSFSPNKLAYDYLACLDLGSEFESDNTAGLIEFVEGPTPGNDYIGVHATDHLSLSLLQNRLNQLNEGVKIEIYK